MSQDKGTITLEELIVQADSLRRYIESLQRAQIEILESINSIESAFLP